MIPNIGININAVIQAANIDIKERIIDVIAIPFPAFFLASTTIPKIIAIKPNNPPITNQPVKKPNIESIKATIAIPFFSPCGLVV